MKKGEVELAKVRVNQIFDLLLTLARKGIVDSDYALIRNNNIGFSKDRAIYIDTGHLAKHTNLNVKKQMDHEFKKRLRPLHDWLAINYPELAKFYEKRQQEIMLSLHESEHANPTPASVAGKSQQDINKPLIPCTHIAKKDPFKPIKPCTIACSCHPKQDVSQDVFIDQLIDEYEQTNPASSSIAGKSQQDINKPLIPCTHIAKRDPFKRIEPCAIACPCSPHPKRGSRIDDQLIFAAKDDIAPFKRNPFDRFKKDSIFV
jgi:hypothetical protein